LFTTSDWPSICKWKVVLMRKVTLAILKRLHHTWSVKTGSVADDEGGKTVQTNNPLEEGIGDGRGGVGVAEGDEVSIFGEVIDHREDDGFAMDFGQAHNEVHRDVDPHLGQYVEGLEQTRQL
jgi:hypothetical protein